MPWPWVVSGVATPPKTEIVTRVISTNAVDRAETAFPFNKNPVFLWEKPSGCCS